MRIVERQELGFWIKQAMLACGDSGESRWEKVQGVSEVVQLDAFTMSLAECCMEELVLCSGLLQESLAMGLLEEANHFVGYILSQDVKAFFMAIRGNTGPVSFAPFPVANLVSTFVKIHSCFHCPSLGLEVEPQPEGASSFFGVLPEELDIVSEPDSHQASVLLPDLGLADYAIVGGAQG
ncbi:hypothetical protein KI387_020251, partial [Taxus chinensis]